MVTDYGEDALLTEERRRFERHVNRCDGCSNYLGQMRTTVRPAGLSRRLKA